MLDLTVRAEEGKGEEVYEYPGGYTDPEHGKRLARTRLEELRFPQETWSGRGRALGLAAGRLFEVRGHPPGRRDLHPGEEAQDRHREDGSRAEDPKRAHAFVRRRSRGMRSGGGRVEVVPLRFGVPG
ncbi:MAG: hypothetical protein A2V77_23320 [Anaeromyxobacter sp. RBG_16_69_14]|nr:MAG: hypothetical protein A2V77_23320 [Anaeromyxobacter sp. RBG_16_69_14]